MLDFGPLDAIFGERIPVARPAMWRMDVDPSEHTRDEIELAIRARDIARDQIGVFIAKEYPRFLFRVDYMIEGGIIKISLPELMPASYGYVIKISEFNSDPGMKCIRRACGELLERHNAPRIFREAMWREVRERYRKQAQGIFNYEMDRMTGRVKRVIPDELRH